MDEITLLPEERTRCEVWSRVMGYHRPVSCFNVGKKQEHADRKFFREPADLCRSEVVTHVESPADQRSASVYAQSKGESPVLDTSPA